jgi:site-specific recombinase XerD
MTAVAATVQAFFSERLIAQRQASPHTVAAHRDAVRMLLLFASSRTAKPLSRLDFTDLSAATVAAFLDHLERERANSARSRNARLAAIHSLFAFAALHHPEHSDDIARVLGLEGRSQRTFCGTPRPCDCCAPVSTSPSSRSGSAAPRGAALYRPRSGQR